MDCSELINKALDCIATSADSILFFNVTFSDKFHFPFLIAWLCFFGIYYAIKFDFINITYFFKSIKIAFSSKLAKKQMNENNAYHLSSSRKILLTSIGEAIDVSAIFGVSMAVIVCGPGVLFWMFIACLIGMPLRFVEISLGCMTRKFDKKTKSVIGGPQRYIEIMFRVIKQRKLGKVVAKAFSVCVIVSTFFSLQINQTMNVAKHIVPAVSGYSLPFAALLALIVMAIIVQGLQMVIKVASQIVKVMSILYVITCALIIIKHADFLLPSMKLIMTDAFSFRAIQGSVLFAVMMGIKRTFFSCDVGQGISSLIYINTMNKNPIQEGIISMSAIVFITLVSIFCSGMIVIVTGSYLNFENSMEAVIAAFDTVSPYMKYTLFAIVPMFALTTAAAWGYFGQNAWKSLFGNKRNTVIFYNVLLFCAYIICGTTQDFGKILYLADIFNFSISIPNILALVIGTRFVLKRYKKELAKRTI